MAIKWLHKFISAKVDGPDSTLIKPSNWNDDHEVTSDTDGFVLGRLPGAGPGDVEEVPAAGLVGMVLQPGFIMPFAAPDTLVPGGWYLCDGGLLDRVIDAALFTAIGTIYGAGDGSTTFAKPDLRGVTLVGKSNMGGADRGNLPGGGVLGQYLGAASTSAGVSVNVFGGVSVNVGVTVSGSLGGNVVGASGGGMAFGGSGVFVQQNDPVAVSGAMNGGGSGSGSFSGSGSGGTAAFSVVQPSVVMNFLIKA